MAPWDLKGARGWLEGGGEDRYHLPAKSDIARTQSRCFTRTVSNETDIVDRRPASSKLEPTAPAILDAGIRPNLVLLKTLWIVLGDKFVLGVSPIR